MSGVSSHSTEQQEETTPCPTQILTAGPDAKHGSEFATVIGKSTKYPFMVTASSKPCANHQTGINGVYRQLVDT